MKLQKLKKMMFEGQFLLPGISQKQIISLNYVMEGLFKKKIPK